MSSLVESYINIFLFSQHLIIFSKVCVFSILKAIRGTGFIVRVPPIHLTFPIFHYNKRTFVICFLLDKYELCLQGVWAPFSIEAPVLHLLKPLLWYDTFVPINCTLIMNFMIFKLFSEDNFKSNCTIKGDSLILFF